MGRSYIILMDGRYSYTQWSFLLAPINFSIFHTPKIDEKYFSDGIKNGKIAWKIDLDSTNLEVKSVELLVNSTIASFLSISWKHHRNILMRILEA